MPVSKPSKAILEILQAEGYIGGYSHEGDGVDQAFRVALKYGPRRQRTITGLRRVSTPGRRIYRGRRELPRVMGGLGIAIVSTSQGVMTDREAARARASAARSWRTCGEGRMSRIGKQPIEIPGGVEVSVGDGNVVTVTGPRGSLSQTMHADMTIVSADGAVRVERPDDEGFHRGLHGLTRTLIANMVLGVTQGFEKRLAIVGVGYRAALKGKDLEIQVGYSHPVAVPQPEGIEFEVPRADPDRGARQRQGPGGRGRREHPEDPQARAVQGQGDPLRERGRPQEGGQGREGSCVMEAGTKRAGRLRRHAPRAQEGRRRRRAAAPGGVPVEPAHLRAADRRRRQPTTLVAASDAEVGAGSPIERAKAVGGLIASRAKEAGHRPGRVRPRRAPVPRAGRRRGRRGA